MLPRKGLCESNPCNQNCLSLLFETPLHPSAVGSVAQPRSATPPAAPELLSLPSLNLPAHAVTDAIDDAVTDASDDAIGRPLASQQPVLAAFGRPSVVASYESSSPLLTEVAGADVEIEGSEEAEARKAVDGHSLKRQSPCE